MDNILKVNFKGRMYWDEPVMNCQDIPESIKHDKSMIDSQLINRAERFFAGVPRINMKEMGEKSMEEFKKRIIKNRYGKK